jgi:aspartyl-tRNA(Asn)/glutamyl-tRNA(Gln) amidotransferase subunit A
MTNITDLTIAELLTQLEQKKLSSTEITKEYLDRIKKVNPALNAYILTTEDKALEMAAQADNNIQAGNKKYLEGIPIGVKDIFCTKDIQTVCASHILDGFIPPYESTVTQNLWDKGAVILGKLNMDEFAMGSANITSYLGPVNSPLKRKQDDKELTPGGSSGGSAAAVAAKICPAA